MSCRSAQYILRKNLSISIFIFSLLSFIYQSCYVQQSVGNWKLPSVSPTAFLLHFNKRQRLWLYNLVESKVVSSRNWRQLFLFSFYIVFLSLFFKAIKLWWWQALPITLYYYLTLFVPVSNYTAFSDHPYCTYLLGYVFGQYFFK